MLEGLGANEVLVEAEKAPAPLPQKPNQGLAAPCVLT